MSYSHPRQVAEASTPGRRCAKHSRKGANNRCKLLPEILSVKNTEIRLVLRFLSMHIIRCLVILLAVDATTV